MNRGKRKMVWLNSSSAGKQNYLELRLNAPKGES